MSKIYATEVMLTIRNRSAVLFRGPVKAITSANLKGRFDVLPEHANFISIIKDYLILHKTDGTEKEIKITRGVLKVRGNSVSVYLGVAADAPATPPAPRIPTAAK